MTRAMLLCAGYGTRLHALAAQRPKPMLPVCNFPILRFGIALLAGYGIRDIVINLHHQGDLIAAELGDGTAWGVRLHYLRESRLLGTGGGLKHALPLLDPEDTDAPFLSLNGKLIFDVDIPALLAAFCQAPPSLGMMVVRKVPAARAWGAVDVDSHTNRVRDILGHGDYMFSGVHVTRPSTVRRLPDGEACMVRQGYLPWLRTGQRVAAFVAPPSYFAEHSTPQRYLQSNIDLLGGAHLRFTPGPLSGIHPEARIHPTAVTRQPVCIARGAEIASGAAVGPDVVVGAGAAIAAGTRIERAVVWPGARVHGAQRNCVITPDAVIDAGAAPLAKQ